MVVFLFQELLRWKTLPLLELENYPEYWFECGVEPSSSFGRSVLFMIG